MAVSQSIHPTQPASAADLRQMVGPDRHRPGAARARLIAEQIAVWAIVGHMKAVTGLTELAEVSDEVVASVATDYDVSIDAVKAALLYYQEHRAVIDGFLEENAAFFA